MSFLERAPENLRTDFLSLVSLFRKVTGCDPRLWGNGAVGFGSYHYKYASGREGDWFLLGFAPRKKDLTVYIMAGFEPLEDLLPRLGKYKLGKSCLYIKRLADINLDLLERIAVESVNMLQTRYKTNTPEGAAGR